MKRQSARLASAAAFAAGLAHVASCSTAPSQGADGFPDDGGSFGTFVDASLPLMGPRPPPPVTTTGECSTSAGCPPGQVCCSPIMGLSICVRGPCPTTPFGPLQLCGISAECLTPGDSCGPPPASIPLQMLDPTGAPLMVCGAPSDGGGDGDAPDAASGDAGDGASASGDEGSIRDEAPAGEGGDDASAD